MIRKFRPALAGVFALLAFASLSARAADNNFQTPAGATAPGAVQMCLNGLGQAVPCGSSGAAPSTVTIAPYGYTITGPEQHNLSITSATGLTVPTGTTYAIVQAKTAAVQYTLDGATTPTSTIGFTLAVGSTISISGASLIASFRAISATGTIDAGFYK